MFNLFSYLQDKVYQELGIQIHDEMELAEFLSELIEDRRRDDDRDKQADEYFNNMYGK